MFKIVLFIALTVLVSACAADRNVNKYDKFERTIEENKESYQPALENSKYEKVKDYVERKNMIKKGL